MLESSTYNLYFLLNGPVGLQKIIHWVKIELISLILYTNIKCEFPKKSTATYLSRELNGDEIQFFAYATTNGSKGCI